MWFYFKFECSFTRNKIVLVRATFNNKIIGNGLNSEHQLTSQSLLLEDELKVDLY